MSARRDGFTAAAFALLFGGARAQDAKPVDAPTPPPKPVSFFREVRPIVQAQCAGCHQPAKAGGKIVLTGHANLLETDRHGDPIVAPGKPDESTLVAAVTPHDGKPPKMPKGKTPLADAQVALLKRWIAEGAHDDTPAAAAETFTPDHPPEYRRQPVVTALDFSPKAPLLAVSGYHEVFLYEVGGEDGAPQERLAARLVGMSERIESVAFSPDGAKLLVVGGSPRAWANCSSGTSPSASSSSRSSASTRSTAGAGRPTELRRVRRRRHSVRAFDVEGRARLLQRGGRGPRARHAFSRTARTS
jgi:mono/diheme cytochrome c family protein